MRTVTKSTAAFDSQAFLAMVGSGKTLLKTKKNHIIFSRKVGVVDNNDGLRIHSSRLNIVLYD